MTLSAGIAHGIDNRFFYRHVMYLASVSQEIFWVKGKVPATHMKSMVIPIQAFSSHPKSLPD
jgi:hypothetical protein